VSIEGVDEIVGADRNVQAGWSVSMPHAGVIGPLLEFLKSGCGPYAAAERSYRRHLRQADDCTLAVCYYVHRWIAAYRLRTARDVKPAALAPAMIASPAKDESVIDLWESSTRLLMKMLAPARYVSVIQPTPQYPTVRKMTESERRWLANPASDHAAALKRSYPELIARAHARPELDVVDMPRIFDAMPEAAYVDDCCHLTAAASERMMRAIARALSTRLPPRDGPKPRR
jgi:hypothetical protein